MSCFRVPFLLVPIPLSESLNRLARETHYVPDEVNHLVGLKCVFEDALIDEL